MTFASVRLGLFVVTYNVHAHSGTHYKILFISHLEHVRRDISPVSISRWMVKTILFCYKKGGGFVDLLGQGLFRPGGGYLPSLFQAGFTRPGSKGRDLGLP